jgi:hypothetical protein
MNSNIKVATSLIAAIMVTLAIGVMSIVELEQNAQEFRLSQNETKLIYGTRVGPMGQEMLVTAR